MQAYGLQAPEPDGELELRLLESLLQPEPERDLAGLLRHGLSSLLERPERARLDPAAHRRLEAAAEIARRFQPRRASARTAVTGPAHAVAHLHDIRGASREVLVALLLDTRNCLIRRELLAVGGLNSAALDPRDVFSPALVAGAAAIILAHNHPSGDPSASPADITTTRRLAEAGRLLGVELLDHLVVARTAYLSMREAGLF